MVNNHRCQVILIAPTPTASRLMLKAKKYGTRYINNKQPVFQNLNYM